MDHGAWIIQNMLQGIDEPLDRLLQLIQWAFVKAFELFMGGRL